MLHFLIGLIQGYFHINRVCVSIFGRSKCSYGNIFNVNKRKDQGRTIPKRFSIILSSLFVTG